MMALLAGVVLVGTAAPAAAGSPTSPVVLDPAALDTVTAGGYSVSVLALGFAEAAGNNYAEADVVNDVQGKGNEFAGSALGIGSAFAMGVGAPANAAADTAASANGDVTVNHTVNKQAGTPGGPIHIQFSSSIGFAYSKSPLVYPVTWF